MEDRVVKHSVHQFLAFFLWFNPSPIPDGIFDHCASFNNQMICPRIIPDLSWVDELYHLWQLESCVGAPPSVHFKIKCSCIGSEHPRITKWGDAFHQLYASYLPKHHRSTMTEILHNILGYAPVPCDSYNHIVWLQTPTLNNHIRLRFNWKVDGSPSISAVY